jgi:hypothetical protein
MTEIEFLHEMVKAAGGDPDMLKDKLKSTYYECLIDCMKNGGGGSGGGGGGSGEYTQPDWGYKEGEIISETNVTAEDPDSIGIVMGLIGTPTTTPVVGETYRVIYNDVEYKTTAVGSDEELYLGNIGAISGGVDTGEPFVISLDIYNNLLILLPVNQQECVVKISIFGKVIETIPSKYIPATKAPYIDFIDAGLSTLTVDSEWGHGDSNLKTKIWDQVKLGLDYGAVQARIKISGSIRFPTRGVYAEDVTYTDEEHIIMIQLAATGITRTDDNVSVEKIFGSCVYGDCVILFEFSEDQTNAAIKKIAYQ